MGMMDWVNSDEDESADGSTDLADDPDGDFGGDFDDDFGGDFDDDFGDDFDDNFGDDFDDGGGSGEIADLQDRVGELETEVSSLSSSVNTVREENKQIGETVSEFDETIRKLLDIYEIVTRGINPFVDDAREMGGLDYDGAFGLFDSAEEEDEDLDTTVASAEAETFFDDDFGGMDPAEGEREAELAAEDELGSEELSGSAPEDALDEDPDAEADPDADGGDDASGTGSSFADLKEEYEAGDGWDEAGDDGLDPDGAFDVEPESDDAESDDAESDDAESDDAEEGTDDLDADDGSDPDDVESDDADEAERDDVDGDPTADAGDDLDPSVVEAFDEADETGSTPAVDRPGRTATGGQAEADADADADVYLDALPETFTSESVVLEWTRYLVSDGGTLGAMRAFRLYERLGWISATVRAELDVYVLGVGVAEDGEGTTLTARHHRESLAYLSRLAGDGSASHALEELATTGRTLDGLRR